MTHVPVQSDRTEDALKAIMLHCLITGRVPMKVGFMYKGARYSARFLAQEATVLAGETVSVDVAKFFLGGDERHGLNFTDLGYGPELFQATTLAQARRRWVTLYGPQRWPSGRAKWRRGAFESFADLTSTKH